MNQKQTDDRGSSVKTKKTFTYSGKDNSKKTSE